jgi:hypothetical protein
MDYIEWNRERVQRGGNNAFSGPYLSQGHKVYFVQIKVLIVCEQPCIKIIVQIQDILVREP